MSYSPETDPDRIEFDRLLAEQKRWLDSLTPEQRTDYDIARIVQSARRSAERTEGGTIHLVPHTGENADRIYAALSEAFEQIEVVTTDQAAGEVVWKVSGPRPDVAGSEPEVAEPEQKT